MKISPLILLIGCVFALFAANKTKVACVGNSITAGNSNYPTYLQTLFGAGYTVENEGVSGTTLLKNGDSPYWTKGRLKQALTFKPDIVTIKLGTNDTKPQNWDKNLNEFKKDYLDMIDTFNSLSTKPRIFLVLPVPVFKNKFDIRDSILKKIIVLINEIGVERNLTVIDANTPLLGLSKYFSDGVHPNTAGADTIAHIIYRALTAKTVVAYEREKPMLPSLKTQQVLVLNAGFSSLQTKNIVFFNPAGRTAPYKWDGNKTKLPPTPMFMKSERKNR